MTRLAGAVTLDSRSVLEPDTGHARLAIITRDGCFTEIDGWNGAIGESRTVFPEPIVAARIAFNCRAVAGLSSDGSLMIADISEKRNVLRIPDEKFQGAADFFAFDASGRVVVAQTRKPGDRSGSTHRPVRSAAKIFW